MGFSNRFRDFERISDTRKLVAYPHLVETETAQLNLQTELVELQNDFFNFLTNCSSKNLKTKIC